MKSKLLFILFGAGIICGCNNDSAPNNLTSIEYGLSFGFCVGYCTQVVGVSPSQVSKTLTPQHDESLSEKTCTESINTFEQLIGKIDIPAFVLLDDIIGCPDCADGGAEWVEITTEDFTKRVVFEWNNEPSELAEILVDLRAYHEQLGQCD